MPALHTPFVKPTVLGTATAAALLGVAVALSAAWVRPVVVILELMIFVAVVNAVADGRTFRRSALAGALAGLLAPVPVFLGAVIIGGARIIHYIPLVGLATVMAANALGGVLLGTCGALPAWQAESARP